MRVGVNAQPLVNSLTGIGQYTLAFLKHLVQNHPDVEWVLYASTPLKTDFFDKFPNVKVSIYPAKSKIHQLFFFVFYMKGVLERDNIAVFWSPTHILPLQKSNKVKYFMSVHDLVCIKMPGTMPITNAIKDRLLFTPSVKIADKIFSLSKCTHQDLVSLFRLKSEPVLVYPAYEKPENNINEEKPLVPGKYVLAICTKEPRKNLQVLLRAYLLLPKTMRAQYKLVFCGGKGWKSAAFMNELSLAAKTNSIINFDYVTDDERNNLYSHASVFVFPTLYEGFGLPVIEAMSYGIPVIISDIPIMHEIAEDAALYADPKSPKAFAEQLERLLTSPELLSEYTYRSAKQYQRHSSWKPGADLIWNELNN